MLTRLKVKGFKNLVDVDVRLGPFTCIAGPNGVGKSNFFDAIIFLSELAEKSLLEAITGVRGETRGAEALRVFSRWHDGNAQEMSFDAEMIVPSKGIDDLGQEAVASTTFLRYSVTIRARPEKNSPIPLLEIAHEELNYIKKNRLPVTLPFAKGKGQKKWRDSVLEGRRTTHFISTKKDQTGTFIKVHEDSGHQGRGKLIKADGLGRTVLSTINTAENPTALIARREMQSWKLLQLEPTQLRKPDEMKAKAVLGSDGRSLAATLNRLLGNKTNSAANATRARLANRLLELVDDVSDVWVDPDDKREILTLMARSRDGIDFRARELSDGTLRFLALAVLEQDPTWGGLLCIEEPENGIHPTRISAILDVLQALAVDLDEPVDTDNPLRQVIVNTHSPEVVGLVPEDSLLLADSAPITQGQTTFRTLQFLPLAKTWRVGKTNGAHTISKGAILKILNALKIALREDEERHEGAPGPRRPTRVAARPEMKQLLLFTQSTNGSNS